GHCGLDIALPEARGTPLAQLFCEEPGVVVQIAAADEPRFAEILARHELADAALYLGAPVSALRVQIRIGETQLDESWAELKRAGFTAHDVHMSDLLGGARSLAEFKGLVACGGFSYGDVLGAGEGWAKSILFHPRVREEFERFFARADSFALGICNGCQMFAALKRIIPGTAHWPRFVRNRSEQYEARFSQVEVLSCPSVLLAGMAGSILPVAVA